MSNAGLHSNRGDIYQNLVALDWLLTLLADKDDTYQAIEIDSVRYLVDDVVAIKPDGALIACQCKKNQSEHKAWSVSDLADELQKAAKLLQNQPKATVCFYSRSSFGDILKLHELAINQPDEQYFLANLGKENGQTNQALSQLKDKASCQLSTFELLKRLGFSVTEDFGPYKNKLLERLQYLTTNAAKAFDALWSFIDQFSGRTSEQQLHGCHGHRITRQDLQDVLGKAGVLLAPPIDEVQVCAEMQQLSAIGRSWKTDIAGKQLPSQTLDHLLEAVHGGKRSILLTGGPGSGKTCLLLALQKRLEQEAAIDQKKLPVFIQSREFADHASDADRRAHGLTDGWVDKLARLAETRKVIVIMDSLDVLSIAREHTVLSYFLAQMDQLLLSPNLTVVTACRSFDRYFDRSLAQREWEVEIACQPLDWQKEVLPLLEGLAIVTSEIDETTRQLLGNPRQLSMFVELAQRNGSFSVPNAQALAQQYLDTVVAADKQLGHDAMLALEALAETMLQQRSLAVPQQAFKGSSLLEQSLCSLHILQKSHGNNLTFGHQTLLDALVISAALRKGATLAGFIGQLAPVPFVRPTIRSFVARLAAGERREFRRQVREVLFSPLAFHIRRLVAETFAEQAPDNADWPLLRDLRKLHPAIFSAIYQRARAIGWHDFWLQFLVPLLEAEGDQDALTRHAYHISTWLNDAPESVLAFWFQHLEALPPEKKFVANQFAFSLRDLHECYLPLAKPLLEKILAYGYLEHSFFGSVLAKAVQAGVLSDAELWQYIIQSVTVDEIKDSYRLRDKLHCQPHEFGDRDGNFLQNRMRASTALLDLAIATIEQWHHIQQAEHGFNHLDFLDASSYGKVHSQHEFRHHDELHVLWAALESAILWHAEQHDSWWQANSAKLAHSPEPALNYIAILALIRSPAANLPLIGEVLASPDLLKSQLHYEHGDLIRQAFHLLAHDEQARIMAAIRQMLSERWAEECNRGWIQECRVKQLAGIPCHLRDAASQSLIDDYVRQYGMPVWQPRIYSRSGYGRSPLSHETLLQTSDSGLVRLLRHYDGYQGFEFDSFTGGEREVGNELAEAASREPHRFMTLLQASWTDLPDSFRESIIEGIAKYLRFTHGNLKPDDGWQVLETVDSPVLFAVLLDELERHPLFWRRKYQAASAIEACAPLANGHDIDRLCFLAVDFANIGVENTISGDKVRWLDKGINSKGGRVAEAILSLTCRLLDERAELPGLLQAVLKRFAMSEFKGITAVVLRHLPRLQYLRPASGWELFDLVMRQPDDLWELAAHCLYYTYRKDFERVAFWLEKLQTTGCEEELEVWGRISALAALDSHTKLDTLLEQLHAMQSPAAWGGAARVWSQAGNAKTHKQQCLAGLRAGLTAEKECAKTVAQKMRSLFVASPSILVPIELITTSFEHLDIAQANGRQELPRHFMEWLNAIADLDIDLALSGAEIYARHLESQEYFHDYKNRFAQLLTRLFAEAEECESTDSGTMLERVVALQDFLLARGINFIDEWLKQAERANG